MQTIEIEIGPEGSSKVRTYGYSGTACRSASQFLEQALGKVSHEVMTPEFHLAEVAQTAIREKRF